MPGTELAIAPSDSLLRLALSYLLETKPGPGSFARGWWPTFEHAAVENGK